MNTASDLNNRTGMGKKILYIENVATIKESNFYYAALQAAHQLGWEFHLAYNCIDYSKEKINELEKDLGLIFHQIDFIRNPFHPGNFKAYRQICRVLDSEHFDIIHCNTPIGGVVGRIAGRSRKIQNILYQAHGFHFYHSSPLLNWLLFYPAEKILARLTDIIVTINQEDFSFAKKHLHSRRGVRYVPGVGIKLNENTDLKNYISKRAQLNVKEDDFIILAVGRLEKNKNCKLILESLNRLQDPNIKVLFCGDGEDLEMLQSMTKQYHLTEQVLFLGRRLDMNEIYPIANCFVLASFREGLSRSIMEAMSFGLPCIVSDIRGNRDLIDEKGGFLFHPEDAGALENSISTLKQSKELQYNMKVYNLQKIKRFSLENVIKELQHIYTELMTCNKEI